VRLAGVAAGYGGDRSGRSPGCRARQPPRLVGFRPKGAAKSCRPATARPQVEPRPPTAGHPGRSFLLDWIDPGAGKQLLTEYGTAWIEERPNLRPKTIRLYSYLFRLHIAPHFEGQALAEINDAKVRRWRKKLLDSGLSTVTTAKAYRLLKAIFNTVVDDGIIRRNPCRIKGAGQEESPERSPLPSPRSTPWPTRSTRDTACSSC
jgi:hypothetical protein